MLKRPGRSGARSPISSGLKLSKLATLMDEAELGVRAYMSFPAPHHAKLHSTDPIKGLNGGISGGPKSSASSQ
ncbi:hypothetical protein GCM10010987_63180 [Bradyrhizobium guangdongense]|uniref:Uncharacterized protein n=1 Tax=Bradyrhizobium guangdongense TaxID=1325090 RepID=A0AA88BBF3_9BRAD|nr:hypothetical protein GCM10010987_63180 [Bradyrhizobium guangdongense]